MSEKLGPIWRVSMGTLAPVVVVITDAAVLIYSIFNLFIHKPAFFSLIRVLFLFASYGKIRWWSHTDAAVCYFLSIYLYSSVYFALARYAGFMKCVFPYIYI